MYGWRDITCGNGGFAAVGPYVAAYSSDGVLWTNSIALTNIDVEFHSIAYGNGLYVAGGDYRTLWVSADGMNWTNPAPELDLRPFVAEVKDIIYVNGGFIGVSGYRGSVLTSPDGVGWSARDLWPPGWYLQGVAFGDGIYVVVGADLVGASGDTTNWVVSPVGWDVYARNVAYGNGRFVVVGHGPVLVSTDGTNWTRTAHISHLQKVAFGAGHFVAVGGEFDFGQPESPVWSSEDGVTWTRRRVFAGESLLAVTYGNGSFVIGGYQEAILQSDPFITLKLTIGATPNITLSGPANRTYDIECSDQSSVWWPLKTVFADTIPFSVSDNSATNGTRLYRAVLK